MFEKGKETEFDTQPPRKVVKILDLCDKSISSLNGKVQKQSKELTDAENRMRDLGEALDKCMAMDNPNEDYCEMLAQRYGRVERKVGILRMSMNTFTQTQDILGQLVDDIEIAVSFEWYEIADMVDVKMFKQLMARGGRNIMKLSQSVNTTYADINEQLIVMLETLGHSYDEIMKTHRAIKEVNHQSASSRKGAWEQYKKTHAKKAETSWTEPTENATANATANDSRKQNNQANNVNM